MARYYAPVQVLLSCTKEWIDEREVEVLNIEEDYIGRDVLTFKCPKCGEKHRSHRVA